MNKFFKSILPLAALLTGMVAVSCEETAPALAASVSVVDAEDGVLEISVGAEVAESQKVKVEAKGDWVINVVDSWIKVSPTCGSGNAEISVSAEKNYEIVDGVEEMAASRVGCFYVEATGNYVTVRVNQEGDILKGDYYKFVHVSEITSGASYVIASFYQEKYQVAFITAANRKASNDGYDYLYTSPVDLQDDCLKVTDEDSVFIIEAETGVENGYTIKDAAGFYLYDKGKNSCNLSSVRLDDASDVWVITFATDGTARIQAKSGKYLALTEYKGTLETCLYVEDSQYIYAWPQLFKRKTE